MTKTGGFLKQSVTYVPRQSVTYVPGSYHEQIFFEDQKGGNIGFFDDGTLKEESNPQGFRTTMTGYDDATMREAVANIPLEPYHLLWRPWPLDGEKNNCQDWAEKVRREYERLKKEKEKKNCSK